MAPLRHLGGNLKASQRCLSTKCIGISRASLRHLGGAYSFLRFQGEKLTVTQK